MERIQINLRIDKLELDEWKRKAEEEDLALSAWIRAKCNAQPLERGNGKIGDNTDVQGIREVYLGKERANVIQRLDEEPPIHRQHDKTCQCGICEFARKAGLK